MVEFCQALSLPPFYRVFHSLFSAEQKREKVGSILVVGFVPANPQFLVLLGLSLKSPQMLVPKLRIQKVRHPLKKVRHPPAL